MLKTAIESFLKKSVRTSHASCLSTHVKTAERFTTFRTTEDSPLKHTYGHAAQFYTIPEGDRKVLFAHGGIPKSYEIQAKTFTEMCLMIRQPSLEIINCLQNLDFSKPAVRFVMYGKKGTGKTLSLAHILHYAFKDNFLIVHVPWVPNWIRKCKEYSNSETKEGYVDLNIDAADWLLHFKTQNAHQLNKAEFNTTEDYVWSKRETTPKGSPLIELIDHGINRIKYASDCVTILCNEIKSLTDNGICKTLVAIDGFNAFFYPNTKVFTEKREVVHPHKITLTKGFLNLTKFDWKNSLIVATVDPITENDQLSYFPRYLLGKEGFEHMDPFIPIRVLDYTEKELLSCMDYYRERKWVQPFPGQDNEVAFISGKNPYKLMKICGPL